MPNKKISFFTSPIGLGHVTRDIAIASYLCKKDTEIKFITGGAAACMLEDLNSYHTYNVYTPPKFKIDHFTGNLQNSTRWLWSYYQYYKDCKKIAKGIIELEKPNIIVSDEDFASLGIGQNMKIKTILITDILNTKFANRWPITAIESKMNKSMCKMIQKCNAVIMPETKKGDKKDDAISRVGPITRRFEKTREEMRQVYKFGDKKIILITVGGTDAGLFLINKALEAISAIKYNNTINTIVIAGPSINLEIPKKHKNIKIIKQVNNLHEMILAADVLISLAGRSTIDEAVAAGTPSVFIPIAGHFEQEENAARNGGFTALDADRLESIIAAKLREPRTTPSKSNGAKKAAELITSYVYD